MRRLIIKPRRLKTSIVGFILLGTALGGLAVACRTRMSGSDVTATPANRKVLGAASPSVPLAPIDLTRLQQNMAYRRQIGWELALSVLTPVSIGRSDLLKEFDKNEAKTLPRWLSWYDGYELAEMFDMLYGSQYFGDEDGLTPEVARQRSRPFSAAALRTIFADHSEKQLLGWTDARFAQELGKIKMQRQLKGLVRGHDGIPSDAGVGMTVFSPELILHTLKNYAGATSCAGKQKDVTFTTAPISADNFTICLQAEFPGIEANKTGSTSPEVAVAIKATWHKVKSTSGQLQDLQVYKHDADSLLKALQAGTWTNTSQQLLPSADKIFTIEVDDKAYMLTGLHIMSKQARHWLWTSLWWAADPDQDFGADRPEAFKALGHGFDNYKMCVVTDFDEGDAAPWQSYEDPVPLQELTAVENAQRSQRLKSLAKSLKAVHSFSKDSAAKSGATGASGVPSWCSNPYIEFAQNNSRTNCIGCHQHAGSDLFGFETIEDEQKFPNAGRQLVRKNFPTDYLWSFSTPPDDFSGRIDEIRSKYE